jgi:AcrR family transcriptional regulator
MARPKQISDEEILEVARECFLTNGISVSAQTIADRVGLSQPALFKRFGTKEELVFQALRPPERLPVLDWLETVPTPGPFEPQIKELLGRIWETLQFILPRIAVLMTSHFTPEQVFARYETPPPLRLIIGIGAYLRRAQENGQIRADADPEALALSVLGVMQGRAFVRFVLRSGNDPDDALYLESAADLLYRGMMPTENDE